MTMETAAAFTLLSTLLIFYGILQVEAIESAACDSAIYCQPGEGSLLHTVQMARLYKDSKTFVDKPLKFEEDEVLENFNNMMAATSENPSKERVQQFVDENFSEEGTEFEEWTPTDWIPEPAMLNKIQDPEYRAFAKDINRIWKDLGRKIKPELESSDTTSLIYLKRPFIVPGGRFREMYYWDSYWTILGLLQSEMTDTVKDMLQNFVDLIEDLGFIPNGNRIYYTRRSQPPVFISMVDEYVKATNDMSFVEDNIETIEQELDFWINNRMKSVSVNNKEYELAVYNVEVDAPRPESYYEDYRDAQNFSTPEEKLEFYMNMKSGAESGWDYSTKWFIDEHGSVSTDLLDIKSRHVIPVELNSYLCKNSAILAEFFRKLGFTDKANTYENIRSNFVEAINAVLWNEEKGAWFDYDTLNNQQRLYFYPSNVAPLWANCYQQNTKAQNKVKSVVAYLKNNKAFDYPGGVPTSLMESGQQWDFANAWPPLQELLVTALENTGDAEAQELALELVKKWVLNNWTSYKQSNFAMFEKYSVTEVGLPGGGGEYDVQEGFGWTNGVILDLLSKYGDKISSDDVIQTSKAPKSILNLGLIFLCWILCLCLQICSLF